MTCRRRDVVVQQVRRRLGIDRTVVEDGEPVLALDPEAAGLLGQRGRDQAARHVAAEGDGGTHDAGHGGEPGAAQEAAPVDAGPASEDEPVGSLGIGLVELADAALSLLVGHSFFLPRVTAGVHTGRDLDGRSPGVVKNNYVFP